jgi:hypothetical protein
MGRRVDQVNIHLEIGKPHRRISPLDAELKATREQHRQASAAVQTGLALGDVRPRGAGTMDAVAQRMIDLLSLLRRGSAIVRLSPEIAALMHSK